MFFGGNLFNSAKYVLLNRVYSSDSEDNINNMMYTKNWLYTATNKPQCATEVRCVVQLKI